jgi:outer membrane protein
MPGMEGEMNALLISLVTLASGEGRSLDLSGWVALALRNSPALEEAGASVSLAQAGIEATRSALLPSLAFGATAGHSWTSSPLIGSFDDENYSASLSLSQELLASGGSSWIDLRSSRRSREAAELDFLAARLQLELDVSNSFYDVVGAIQMLASSEAALERSVRQLEKTRALYDLGAATSLEMVQAQVSESMDRLAVTRQRQALQSSYSRLYLSAGLGSPAESLMVDTSAVLDPMTLEQARAFDVDLSQNPSLQSSSLRGESSRMGLSSARRAYWPSLSASASWTWNSNRFDPADIADEDGWNVQARLTWPIFDGWLRESRIHSAAATVLSSESSRRSLENQLSSGLSDARNALLTSVESYDLARLSLEYATRQLELSRMNYELGGLSLLDLLQAQAALAEAEAAVVTARVDCLKAEARLCVLAGRSPRLGE